MTVKGLKYVFLVAVCGLVLAGNVAAQSATKPSETVKSFYSWYLNAGEKRMTSPKVKPFVTTRLFNKIVKLAKTADGDFYTGEAADLNVSPGKAHILSEKRNGAKTTVLVLLKSSEKYSTEDKENRQIRAKIVLIKEKGVWKINDVIPLYE